MADKEATARIKINKLLEAAGWRFFADGLAPANIRLEPSVTIKSNDLDALGDDFEKSSKGFVDFLLLDAKGLGLADAEVLADKLAQRDRSVDDRRLCAECAHLAGHAATSWSCRNWQQAGVAIRSKDAQLPADLVRQLQRCEGFKEAL